MAGDELVVIATDERGVPLGEAAVVTALVTGAAPVVMSRKGNSYRASLARSEHPSSLAISIELAGARYVAYDTLGKR